MALVINTNISALKAVQSLNKTSQDLADVFQRLSSGSRLNRASDDAADLAIADGLNSKSRITAKAIQNVSDGLSLASIQEGALNSLNDITGRLQELSEQAANGTYSTTQRNAINNEAGKLVDEYNRIMSSTTFNGINIFDPNSNGVQIQTGTGATNNITIDTNSGISYSANGQFEGFANGQQIPGITPSGNYYVGDFNGDGKEDVIDVVVDSGGGKYGYNIDYLAGNGDGTFASGVTFSITSNNSQFFDPTGGQLNITIKDVDGDGKLDIANLSPNGVSWVAFGNGDGSFGTAISFTTVANATMSIESNGNILAVGTGGAQQLNLVKSYGLYAPSAPQTIPAITGNNVLFGDFNGDGIEDFAVLNSAGNENIYKSSGNGQYSLARTITIGSGDVFTVGDINGDGVDDLLMVDSGGDATEFLGHSGASIVFSTSGFSTEDTSDGFLLADINGDGKVDLVNRDNGDVILQNSNGTFGADTQNYPGQVLSILDLNGDGKLDEILADGTFALGNGDGTFTSSGANSSIASGYNTFADFNGDGVLDAFGSDSNGDPTLALSQSNTVKEDTISYLDLTTVAGARTALTTVNTIQQRVTTQLGLLGASESRLQTAQNVLSSLKVNDDAAESRISDTDVAQDTARLLSLEILQQSQTAIISHSEQSSKIVLSLLDSGWETLARSYLSF